MVYAFRIVLSLSAFEDCTSITTPVIILQVISLFQHKTAKLLVRIIATNPSEHQRGLPPGDLTHQRKVAKHLMRGFATDLTEHPTCPWQGSEAPCAM